MKSYKIITIMDVTEFVGEHLKDKESENWHYYKTEDGDILHFRKKHMVSVLEKNINKIAT